MRQQSPNRYKLPSSLARESLPTPSSQYGADLSSDSSSWETLSRCDLRMLRSATKSFQKDSQFQGNRIVVFRTRCGASERERKGRRRRTHWSLKIVGWEEIKGALQTVQLIMTFGAFFATPSCTQQKKGRKKKLSCQSLWWRRVRGRTACVGFYSGSIGVCCFLVSGGCDKARWSRRKQMGEMADRDWKQQKILAFGRIHLGGSSGVAYLLSWLGWEIEMTNRFRWSISSVR